LRQGYKVVVKYIWEIYGKRQRRGVWGRVVSLPTENSVWDPGGGYAPLQKKCKLHAEQLVHNVV